MDPQYTSVRVSAEEFTQLDHAYQVSRQGVTKAKIWRAAVTKYQPNNDSPLVPSTHDGEVLKVPRQVVDQVGDNKLLRKMLLQYLQRFKATPIRLDPEDIAEITRGNTTLNKLNTQHQQRGELYDLD